MDDHVYDQLSLKEFIDPFTGEPVVKGKKGPCEDYSRECGADCKIKQNML